jgi:biotin synthase
MIDDLLKKSIDGEDLTADELGTLFDVPLFSEESAKIVATSRVKSERACNGHAEIHAQIGLNIAPCSMNCMFCSFAEANKVFKESTEIPIEEVLMRAQRFEADGSNAVLLMGTAHYPPSKFVEVMQEVRRNLKPETILLANTGDMSLKQARELKDAGCSGVYHAVRLGEGRDTSIPVEHRLNTMKILHEAGLLLGTCLEPVGPEHKTSELVEKTLITRDVKPTYSGAARRIPIPGTELARHGLVSEARMAHILAVVRHALGYDVPGNCTHEPNVIGVAAGATLVWAEAGANPRDTAENTEGHRGMTVPDCRKIYEEAEWKVLEGPSKYYSP